MNVSRTARLTILVILAMTLLLTSGIPPAARAAPPAQGIADVVPFLGVFVGWSHRNRIYRNANEFIADRNRYYDSLRDTARKQLVDREVGGLRQSQVAAYVKLVALVEHDRKAEIAQAEARKRGAREAFNDRLEGVLLQRVLGTEALQRLFGALTKGVRSSQDLINGALDKLSGGGGGALAELERVRTIARDVETVAGMIGGRTGEGLRRTAAQLASRIERPQQMIRADLERARDEIGGLGQTVDTLARVGRQPSAGALAERLVLRPPGGSDDPAVEAIAILISKLSVGDGSLRDQARAAVQAGFVGRCVGIASKIREARARLEGGAGAGLSAAEAVAPCRAIDVAELVRNAQATEAAGIPSEGAAEQPEGPTVTEEVAPLEDRCSLTGEGDFVIENLQVSSVSNSCADSQYPFGMGAEPFLVYLAAAGRWVIASEGPESTTWTWQPTTDLQGAVVEGRAQTEGGTLVIDTTLSVQSSKTSLAPLPTPGNGIALAALLPMVPLAISISSRRRRRFALLAITSLAFLLTAQSCEVNGSFSGHYTFPIPEEGFACEIPPENPNLAEMPGSSGQVSMQFTVTDDNGKGESCTTSASVTGVGVLKRDGFYTEESLQQSQE